MSQPSNGSSEEDDISPLEYARFNGLSYNYLDEPAAFIHAGILQKRAEASLSDDSHLQTFDLGREIKIEERLTVSRGGAQLLASVSNGEAPESINSLVLPLLDSRTAKEIKLELPLLKSEHEVDCRDFARRHGFEVKLRDIKLPLEMVDEKNGEGLNLSSKLWSLGTKVLEELKLEKIAVSKDTLGYLQTTIKNVWTPEDDNKLWNSEQRYKRNTALDPVTPPLSPMPTPLQPYEPALSSPAFQVPILSDPPSLITEDLKAIEQKIFEQDIPIPIRKAMTTDQYSNTSSEIYANDEHPKFGDIYSPLAFLDNTEAPQAIERKRPKFEDLKVEETLTPPKPVPKPIEALQKSVRFSNIVEELDLEPQSPSPDAFASKFFEEAFGEAHERATQMSQQERLIEADATARVEVRTMDFSKPDPPWNMFEQCKDPTTLLRMQKEMMENIVGQHHKEWPGVKQAIGKLNCCPFPMHLAKTAVQEEFEDGDTTWEVFVQVSEDWVINSSTQVRKPPGLRILRDEDDEDEIEPAEFLKDQPHDMSYLVKKRKMALEESGPSASFKKELLKQGPRQIDGLNQGNGASPTTSVVRRKNTPRPGPSVPAADMMEIDHPEEQGFGSLLGGTFSAGAALDSFLETRGAKKPKLTNSSYFSKKPEEPVSRPQSVNTAPQKQMLHLPIRKSPAAKADPLPAPTFAPPKPQTNIIIASTMLRHRGLIRNIEKLIPNLNLIERDFTAHNTTMWLPGSASRSTVVSPLAFEADMVVSPSASIMLTTLQKMKQKPLPGSKGKPALQERLEKVSLKYENLFVFIGENRADETSNGLDQTDCIALAEFIGFASGLDTNILVQFVGGGEVTLSKWIVSIILQHVMSDQELLLDETHWELFLRRAGMNAFAAQKILAELKAPGGVDTGSPTKAGQFGLTAFIEMGRKQRIARFGNTCGRRLLERVSAVVDTRWA